MTNNVHRSDFELNIRDRQLKSDYYIEDASFVKLDNFTIGYSVRNSKIFKNLRFFVTGNNLVTLTGYTGQDPELPQVNGGIDNNVYPASRNFLLGLSTSF